MAPIVSQKPIAPQSSWQMIIPRSSSIQSPNTIHGAICLQLSACVDSAFCRALPPRGRDPGLVDDAPDAFAALQQCGHVGKIVVTG